MPMTMLPSEATTATSATSTASTNARTNPSNSLSTSSAPARKSSRASSVMHEMVLTSGDNFYDDGYNQHELNMDVPRTLFKANNNGNVGGNANSSDSYCRKKELAMLRHAFDQMMTQGKQRGASASTTPEATPTLTSTPMPTSTSNPSIPAAFVWGGSGTGKSHLVDTFCERISNERRSDGVNVHIIKGKFEQHQKNDPYSAITQAFSDWCSSLLLSTAGKGSDKQNGMANSKQSISWGDGTNDNTHMNTPANTSLKRLRTRVKASQMTSEQAELLQTFIPPLSILFNDGADAQQSGSGTQSQSQAQPHPNSRTSQMSNNDTAWNTFQYAFVQFLTAVSSKACPLVLVLDDLQWASQDSMNLLSTLLHRPHFLWMGTIRQEYNPHSHDELLDPDASLPFMKLLDEMRQGQPQDLPAVATPGVDTAISLALPYVSVQLANFTRQELHDWVSQLFRQSDNETTSHEIASGHSHDHSEAKEEEEDARDEYTIDLINSIVDFLFKQTKGNIFHAVQLLQDMEQNNVLTYNRISFQWELSGDLNANSDANRNTLPGDSGDVLHLVTSKLRALPVEMQRVLAIASYIRSSFDSSLLQAVLDHEQNHSHSHGHVHEDIFEGSDANACANAGTNARKSTDDASKNQKHRSLFDLLEDAVLEGLLHNSIGATTYRFAHDRIQQAAHDLVPYGETRTKLRLCIGRCLWGLCTSAESSMANQGTPGHGGVHASIANDTGLMFIAAEHLNCVPDKDHLRTMQRNLRTGEHALQMTALVPAATYLQIAATALRKLKCDPWQSHYDLTLRLLRGRCDVELLLGNYEQGYSIGEEVLKHATALIDKLPTYDAMARALAKEGKHQKSLQMSKKCAQMCSLYPKRGILLRGLRQLVSLRSYFRRTSDEEFLENATVITDPQTLLPISLLRQLTARTLLCNDTKAWLLTVTRLVDITRRVGICGECANAMVSFAMIHNKLGEYTNARRYVELAKKIIRKVGENNRYTSFVYCLAALFIDQYSKPPAEVASDFQYSYSSAMSKGEFEIGILAHYGYIFHAFNQGYPLGGLLPAIDSVFEQMKMYKMNGHFESITEYTSAPRKIAGALPIDWQECMDWKKYENSAFRFQFAAFWSRMCLAIYFGKYEFAEMLYEKMVAGKLVSTDAAIQTMIIMFCGLMASNRYRKTKQKRFMKILRQKKQELKKICDEKGNSAINRYLLLRAEMKSIKSSASLPTYIRNCYEASIDGAEQAGQLHEAGLACELAGEHVLTSSVDSNDLARPYFTKAMGFYQAWGGVAKCADFRNRRGEYIDEDQVKRGGWNGVGGGKAFAFEIRDKTKASFDMLSVYTPTTNTMARTFAGAKSVQQAPTSPNGMGGTHVSAGSKGSRAAGSGTNDDDDDDDHSALSDLS